MTVELRAITKRPGSEYTPRARHQEASPDAIATLQDPSQELLSAAEWAAWHRGAVEMKDKTYRRYPLGEDVGHFLRFLRVKRRALNTRESYETVLCRLVLDHLDVDSLDRFCAPDGHDLLIGFLDRHWGDSSGDTLGQRAAVLSSFFKWARKSGRVPFNPAEELEVPRGSRRLRVAHDLEEIQRIAKAQPRSRTRAACSSTGGSRFARWKAHDCRPRT